MSGLGIDKKRNYHIEVERHDIAWWSVHVSNEDELFATLSARDLSVALTAVAAVFDYELQAA
jgi:hypothetical protein